MRATVKDTPWYRVQGIDEAHAAKYTEPFCAAAVERLVHDMVQITSISA
jgi:hypothetical protein